MQHALELLAGHPAALEAKLEAFAMFNSITAMFVQHELAGASALQERQLRYLWDALGTGQFPRLAQLLSAAGEGGPAGPQPPDPQPPDPAGRYADIMARILTGLLGPAQSRPE
jgi:hypothetical protein